MKEDLVIYGSGGLGREVLRLAQNLNKWNILGFVDDGKKAGDNVDKFSILSPLIFNKNRTGKLNVIIGIADPVSKNKIYSQLSKIRNITFPSIISPEAHVEPDARIGEGCIIFAYSFISINTTLGRCVLVEVASHVGHDVQIDDFSTLMPSCDISGYVTIGKGCLVGAQSFILQGKSVDKGATIIAGSKVFSNIANDVTVFGYPASVLGEQRKKLLNNK